MAQMIYPQIQATLMSQVRSDVQKSAVVTQGLQHSTELPVNNLCLHRANETKYSVGSAQEVSPARGQQQQEHSRPQQ